MEILLEELTVFLNEANKSTYANKDESKITPPLLKSKDYHFEKDNFIYHDTHFGDRDFIGEEVICKENEPVWAMNYYGYILNLSDSDLDKLHI